MVVTTVAVAAAVAAQGGVKGISCCGKFQSCATKPSLEAGGDEGRHSVRQDAPHGARAAHANLPNYGGFQSRVPLWNTLNFLGNMLYKHVHLCMMYMRCPTATSV